MNSRYCHVLDCGKKSITEASLWRLARKDTTAFQFGRSCGLCCKHWNINRIKSVPSELEISSKCESISTRKFFPGPSTRSSAYRKQISSQQCIVKATYTNIRGCANTFIWLIITALNSQRNNLHGLVACFFHLGD